MNTEYLWWFLALLLAGLGMVAFLALGRVPEIEDEPAQRQSSPASTTVPTPDAPASTSETP
jgi:hypothetical protein